MNLRFLVAMGLLTTAMVPVVSAQESADAFFRSPLSEMPMFYGDNPPGGGTNNGPLTIFPNTTHVSGRAPLSIDIGVVIVGGEGEYLVNDNSDSLAFARGASRDVGNIVGQVYSSMVYRMFATDQITGQTSANTEIVLDVAPPLTLAVPSSELASVRPGAPISIQPQVTGQIGSLDWEYVGPGVLTLDGATGELTGVAGAPGPIDGMVLSITDDSDGAFVATDPFALMVEAEAIAIAVNDTAWRLPTAISFPVSVTGGYGTVNLEAELPAGLTLADGTVSGSIADTGLQQSFPIPFTATDAYETPGGTRTATVTVNPALSVAVPASTVITVNEPVSIPVTSLGVVGNGTLDLADGAPNLPAGLTADFAAGAIVGTATVSETIGGLSLALTDSEDGAVATSNAFSIRVNGVHLPGDFTVPAVGSAQPGAVVSSIPVPVEGYAGTLRISVAGGASPAVSLDNGLTWSAADDIAAGQSFLVRQTAATAYGGEVSATVTIADKSAPFVVTTRPQDLTPTTFSIPAISNAARSASVTSAAVTVTGIEGQVPISVTNGTISVGGGSATTATTIQDGQSFTVTATTSATYSTAVVANVTVGTFTTPFSVTTLVQDTTPNSFTITPVTGATRSAATTSAAVTVTGIEGDVPISVTNGTVKVGSDSPATSTTIANGESFVVNTTASSNYGTAVVANVTVGTYSTSFSVTTLNEYTRTLSNSTAVNIQTLFSTAEWTSSEPKRVIIPSGVIIGSNSPSTPALRTGSGRGGTLTIENAGEIRGAGGAVNSGTGGTALLSDQQTIIRNTGAIRAGGGGGGRAGNGGQGYYSNPTTITEGPYFVQWTYVWNDAGAVYYNGQYIPMAAGASSVSSGGWTYYRGSHQWSTYYSVYRQQSSSNTVYTNGGVAGNGGRGQGYDGAATVGAAAVAGGTNAGASGKSGDGGGWGATGQAGASGATGNYSGGLGGSSGGSPGYAISGPHTLEVTGTKQGL